MRRRFFSKETLNNSIIIYTSIDNQIITPYIADFGSALFQNIMVDGLGKMRFFSTVIRIGERAFLRSYTLTSIILPNRVTLIEHGAFSQCENLTSVTIPDSVTTIGDEAFYTCYSLTSITIPDSVTEIGYMAFWGCESLTSVTIGNSVTMIGESAFYRCTSLTSVYCKATTPPTLSDYGVFYYNGSGRKIYVPYQSLDAYKTAQYWTEYADDIVGHDFENDTVVGVEFPISLVLNSDNGKLGVDLYNYLIAVMPEGTNVSCPNDEYGIGEIIIEGWGNADELRIFSAGTAKNIQITNSIMRENSLTPSLRSDGYFS